MNIIEGALCGVVVGWLSYFITGFIFSAFGIEKQFITKDEKSGKLTVIFAIIGIIFSYKI